MDINEPRAFRPGRLSKADRHARILSDLKRAPALRVAELAADLHVSTETVRRDLDALTEQGLLARTYGGAVGLAAEPALAERHRMLAAERQAIAEVACAQVQPGQVVALGGGSTTLHVARLLAGVAGALTVVTHSFSAARALASNPACRVLFVPGVVNADEDCTAGPQAIEFLQTVHADLAIVGASGLTAEGPNDVDPANAAVYRTMMQRAERAMVVADHSKFERRSLAVYGPWSRVALLATDVAPPGLLAAALAQAGTRVLLAQ